MNCTRLRDELVELALDPAATPDETARRHLESCEECRTELASLRATMGLMDDWTAPEPSPYFDARLRARLREEQAAPAGFWQRAWATLRGDGVHAIGLRPALAGALALLLIVGGGSYLGLDLESHHAPAVASAAVSDLQTLDNNNQLLREIDTLEDSSDQDAGGPAQGSPGLSQL